MKCPLRLIAIACGIALALLGTWCAQHGDSPVQSSASAVQTSGAEPSAAAARTPSAIEAASAADAGIDAAVSAPAAAPQNSVARMMRATDEHDRVLLSDIERQTKAPLPESVRALLALRRAGKSRAELQQHIEQNMRGEVLVRMLSMRWLREISGDSSPSNSPVAPAVKLRTQSELHGPRQVQPVKRVTSP